MEITDERTLACKAIAFYQDKKLLLADTLVFVTAHEARPLVRRSTGYTTRSDDSHQDHSERPHQGTWGHVEHS